MYQESQVIQQQYTASEALLALGTHHIRLTGQIGIIPGFSPN